MTITKHMAGRRARRGTAAVGLLLAGLVAEALPAGAHASIPTAPAFGFAPNPAGGTGALGTTSPYVPGAFTSITLRAPFEQTVPFNGSDDTTVDVRVTVPAGWTDPQCGPAKAQIKDATTSNTNQPGADVSGWSCEVLDVSGHKALHWSGPQVVAPANKADSAQFFVLSITTPTPTVQTTYDGTNGTEGFITDQEYASGEIVHWIPNAAYPGTVPAGAESVVATGLVRTVAGPGTGYTSVSPTRILDSRGPIGGWNAPLSAGSPKTLTVTGGAATVPSDADAVVVNITATGSSNASYLTAYPAGSAAPNASNLNFDAAQNVAGLAVVKVGTAGQITLANATGSTHVVVDLVGYFSAASTGKYNALDPTRLLDSRSGIGGWTTKLGVGATQSVQVRSQAGVPSTAGSVVVNLTATGATAGTYLTAYPAGETAPTASNLNVAANQNLANLAIVKIGTDGKIAIRNDAGSTDVIADVVGYFDATSGDLFHSLAPRRVLDSRLTAGGWSAPLLASTPRSLAVKGVSGVRVDAHSFIANATVTGTTADGYLTVYPTGATQPNASTLNYTAGATVPNLVVSKVGNGGQVSFATAAGSTNVLLDVVGYFAGS